MSSLVDALLLDTWRDPRDIHIALRTDGQRGSGTAEDPYDGGARLGSALSATVTFDPHEAIVVTRLPHGFSQSNTVTIANVSGESAADFNRTFSNATNPDFQIVNPYTFKLYLRHLLTDPPNTPPLTPDSPSVGYLSATSNGITPEGGLHLVWPVFRLQIDTSAFAQAQVLRISGAPSPLNGDFVVMTYGDGYAWCLLTNPVPSGLNVISGGCSCARLIYRLDEVLQTALSHSIIRFGPGTFETRGDARHYRARTDQPRSGFTVKTAMKIHGAGRDITVLKLVQAVESVEQTYALLSDLPESGLGGHFCEVADLTVDCNLGGQPIPAAIGVAPVTCAAVALYGDYTRLRGLRAINWGPQAVSECFVLYQRGGANNVAEYCVVEKPGENNTHETSLLSVVGDSDFPAARGGIARHNYLSSEYANGFGNHPLLVKSVTRDASDLTLAHLETWEPHDHVEWKNLVVRGVQDADYNGVFPIIEDPSDSPVKLSYRTYAIPGTTTPDATGATIGHARSSELVAISDVDYDLAHPENGVRITTKRPHQRTKGQAIIFGGVPTVGLKISHGAYHRVLDILSPTQFIIAFPPTLVVPAPPPLDRGANVGSDFHGPFAFGGAGMITEGNSVYDLRLANYTDTGGTRDATVRDNYWSNVTNGCYHLQNRVGSPKPGAGPTLEGTDIEADGAITHSGAVATFTALSAHGLSDNDYVVIRGVTGADQSLYQGLFQITVSNPSQFTYTMAGTPTDVSSLGAVARKVTAGAITSAANIATFEVPSPHSHNLAINDVVLISGVTGEYQHLYNGLFVVQSTDDSRHFTYNMVGNPLDPAPPGSYAQKQIASCLTHNGLDARFTTPASAPHNLFAGDAVVINEAIVTGSLVNPFNSTFTVKAVISPIEFLVELRANPTGIALGPPSYAPRHQTRRFAVMNNIIEVRPADANTAEDPIGVALVAEALPGLVEGDPLAFLYPQLIIRENFIRHVNNGNDTRPEPSTAGITVVTARRLLIEDNVLENKRVFEGGDLRLEVLVSKEVHSFRNTNFGGSRIHPYDSHAHEYSEQLEDRVELGLVLALL